jgi:hypothetical protein
MDEIEPLLPFKKDTPTIHHDDVKNIPSVQDSSTGARHSQNVLGNFLAINSQGMTLKHEKKHTKKYYEDIQKAKNQIKVAEKGMKQMDTEVKDFHNHMANSMSGLMKAFNDGFAALDKAKKEEVNKEQTGKKDEPVEAKKEENAEAKKEDLAEAKKEETAETKKEESTETKKEESTEFKETEKKEEATESKESKETTNELSDSSQVVLAEASPPPAAPVKKVKSAVKKPCPVQKAKKPLAKKPLATPQKPT